MSDLIRRSDAIDVVKKNHYRLEGHGLTEELLIEQMRSVPSADRPRGEWIEQEDDYHHYWECSECGMGVGLDDIRNYCPNCGAKMDGERKGE